MWIETIGGGGGGGSGASGFTITTNKLYSVSLSGGGGGAAGSYNSTMIHSKALQISGLPVKMIAYIGLGGQGAASKTVTATYNASGTYVGAGSAGSRGGTTSLSITNSTAIGSYSCALSTNGSTNSYLIFASLPSITTGSFIYLNNQFNTIGGYTLTSGYYYFQLSIILPISFNNPTIFNSYTIYYPFTSTANTITNTYCVSFGGEGGYGGVTSNTAVTAAQTGISTFPAQSNTGIGVYGNTGGSGLRGSYGQGGSGGGGGGCTTTAYYNGGVGGYVLSNGVYDATTPTAGIYGGAALAGAAGTSKGYFPGTGGGGGACSTSIGNVFNIGGNGGYGAAGGGGGAITGPSTGYTITQNTTVLSGPGGNGGSGLFKAIFYL